MAATPAAYNANVLLMLALIRRPAVSFFIEIKEYHHLINSIIMKNRRIDLFAYCLLCCCLWAGIAGGQNAPLQENAAFTLHRLSTDLAPLYWGSQFLTSEYGLAYEYRWSGRQQSGLRLSLIGFNFLLKPNDLEDGERRRDRVRANGYSAGVFHKIFLGNDGRKNWYIAPEISYFYTHYEDQRSDDEFSLKKLRNALRFGREQLVLGQIIFDCAVGLAINVKNYAWESIGSGQSSSSGSSTVDERWSTGWGLVQRPAVGLGFPISVRIGYQF